MMGCRGVSAKEIGVPARVLPLPKGEGKERTAVPSTIRDARTLPGELRRLEMSAESAKNGLIRQHSPQTLDLIADVAKPAGPLGFVELVERLARRGPLFLMDFRRRQSEQAGRFQPPQFGDLFPLVDRFVPAVLLLPQLGHRLMVFRLIRAGFDDARGGPLPHSEKRQAAASTCPRWTVPPRSVGR
jgi:hypothetical protein